MTLVPCNSPGQIQKHIIKKDTKADRVVTLKTHSQWLWPSENGTRLPPESAGTPFLESECPPSLVSPSLVCLRTSYSHPGTLRRGTSFSPSNSYLYLKAHLTVRWPNKPLVSESLIKQHDTVVKNTGSGIGLSSDSSFATCVWFWVSHWTSLGFSSPSVKIIPTSQDCCN